MSHALTASPTIPSGVTVTVPDGGDNRTAASVTTPMQALWNAITWLSGVLLGTIAQAVTVNGTISTSTQDITAGADLVATQDVIADRNAIISFDVNAGRDANITRDVSAGRNVVAAGYDQPAQGYVDRTNFIASGTTTTTASKRAYDAYHAEALSADCTITINDATAFTGESIRFSCGSTAHSLIVHDPVGGLLFSLKIVSGGGGARAGVAAKRGTNDWIGIGLEVIP